VHPVNAETVTISYSVKFEDKAFIDDLQASLRFVVKERDELIHKKLAIFDPESSGACRNLARELEDQRQRIKPQFETLTAIWCSLGQLNKEILEYVNAGQSEIDFDRAGEKRVRLWTPQ